MVDTNDIISNEGDIFRNHRTAMWIEAEDNDLNLAKTAPRNTLLERLFRLKNTDPLTKIKQGLNTNLDRILKKSFWFSSGASGKHPKLRSYTH